MVPQYHAHSVLAPKVAHLRRVQPDVIAMNDAYPHAMRIHHFHLRGSQHHRVDQISVIPRLFHGQAVERHVLIRQGPNGSVRVGMPPGLEWTKGDQLVAKQLVVATGGT